MKHRSGSFADALRGVKLLFVRKSTHAHAHAHGRLLGDDCAALGLAAGTLLAALDFRQYLLYATLCAVSAMDADAMAAALAAWTARGSVVAMAWELCSGCFTDALRPHQHLWSLRWLPLASALALVAAVALALQQPRLLALAECVFHASGLCNAQATTSLWVALKLRLGSCGGDAEQGASSAVSAIGDVAAEVSEAALLALSALMVVVRPQHMAGIALACESVLLGLSVVSCFSAASDISGSESFHGATHSEEMESSKPAASSLLELSSGNAPLMHSFWHAQVGLVLFGLLGSPLNLALATSVPLPSSPSPLKLANTAEPKCPGVVVELLAQGAIVNVSFLAGAVLYSATMLKRTPRAFYGMLLNSISGLTTVALLAVPLVSLLHGSILRLLLVSVSQVVVYHLNSYDFSVLTACTPANRYGAVMAVYAAVSHILHLLATAAIWAHLSAGSIIVMCTLLLAFLATYGHWMRGLFLRQDWARPCVVVV